jgi:hypothetical protein
MPDDTTAHLGLPLPHPDNLLSEDVGRLRDALSAIDGAFDAQSQTLNQSLADTTSAVNQSLADTTHTLNQALVTTTTTLNTAVAQQGDALALAVRRIRRRADLHRLMQLEIP